LKSVELYPKFFLLNESLLLLHDMARIKKKRFRTPHEKYQEHKRNAKIIAVVVTIAMIVYSIKNRHKIQIWLESFT